MKTIRYSRSRFNTRLPEGYHYAASHFWIEPQGDNVLRVGLTKFATRMLGDLVDMGFSLNPKQDFRLGDTIGWLESLKAATDIYAVVEGQFLRENPSLFDEPELLDTKPYTDGWLYEAIGDKDPDCLDVEAYIQLLDETIDRLLEEAHDVQ